MMMAYTICSANDLGRARAMANSLREQLPDVSVFICLTDKIQGRFSSIEFTPSKIIEADVSFIPSLQEMSSYYTVTELNCSLKPFFGDYIFSNYAPDQLLYFDTDILFFDKLDLIIECFEKHSILLTPHVLQPLPQDGKLPLERHMLSAGSFNGGFIGMKKGTITNDFLKWWKTRLVSQCFINPCEGMFYDQNWLNFVPLYFEGVKIIKNEGCNVAYWNLHERSITYDTDSKKFFVNQTTPLVFFHFSGYDPNNSLEISKHQNRFSLEDSNVLRQLFKSYQKLLEDNNFSRYVTLSCAYGKKKAQSSNSKKLLIKLFSSLGYEIVKKKL